jgi:hypothetical protein
VTFNAAGLKAGAEAPDHITGHLAIRHEYLRRLEESPEVVEIETDEFDRLCKAFALKRAN